MGSLMRIKNSTLEKDIHEWNEFLELRQEQQLQRMDIIAELYQEPPSEKLQAYLQRLKRGPDKTDSNGCPIWDRDNFVKGVRRFAKLLGCQRSEYYDNPLKGLHYPHTFLDQWVRSYPQLPAPLWLDDFRWQCPPGWLSKIVRPHNAWVLSYKGTEPLSQALNRLILGPTTVDCGMCSALVVWFGIRYVFGDGWFDRLFPFKISPFILTQKWQLRVDKDGTTGNLLYDFYDSYTDETSDSTPETQTNIQIRTVYNHPLYLAKHPGGAARLHNIVQIGTECIIFDPLGSNVLSPEELDLRLFEAFNKRQTPADLEEVELYNTDPEHVDARRRPKSWGDLAEEAVALANHTLTKSEWDESLRERTKRARDLHRVFDIEKLIECARAAVTDLGCGENVEGEVFRRVKRMNQNRFIQTTLRLFLKQTEEHSGSQSR